MLAAAKQTNDLSKHKMTDIIKIKHMKERITQILQEIVVIPSFVDDTQTEKDYALYVEQFLKKFPEITIERQMISNNRWNLIATTPGESHLLLASHLDTVPLSSGWSYDPWGNDVQDDRLYGLGSADTKASAAAYLALIEKLSHEGLLKNITFLFYCGEEYDFIGMKTFIEKQAEKPAWKLAICGEPTQLAIGSGQRGVIELDVELYGASGHAAKRNGASATEAFLIVADKLQRFIAGFQHEKLGKPTLNIASINAGLLQDELVLSHGNVMPDYLQATLEIRTTSNELNAAAVSNYLTDIVDSLDRIAITSHIIHDIPVMYNEITKFSTLQDAYAKNELVMKTTDPIKQGYSDVEMIASAFGIPGCSFGPIGGSQHAPDEWVDLNSIEQMLNILLDLMKQIQKEAA